MNALNVFSRLLIGFILIFLISLILKFQVFISYFTFLIIFHQLKKKASLQWQLLTNSLSLLGNVSYLWKYFFIDPMFTHSCMHARMVNRVNCLSFTFTLMLTDKSVKAYIPFPLPSLEMCWNLCTFIWLIYIFEILYLQLPVGYIKIDIPAQTLVCNLLPNTDQWMQIFWTDTQFGETSVYPNLLKLGLHSDWGWKMD